MLTPTESSGAKRLLAHLPPGELMSLAGTVTQNQLALGSVEEATQAILLYTCKPYELLRRKKMRREVLFQYLHNEHVIVPPNAEKFVIIQAVLKHWGANFVPLNLLTETDDLISLPTEAQQPSNPVLSLNNGSSNSLMRNDNNSWLDDSLQSSTEDQEMALQFSLWFYPMLNACNPFQVAASDDKFGTEHFFQDCILHVLSCIRGANGGETKSEKYTGAEIVMQRLRALVCDERIIFNPNLESNGVRGSSDPHGRRVIFVCGTIHSVASSVVGLFEQQFGLIRDPFANNNWKIKSSRLALTTTTMLDRLPTLDETRLMLTAN